MKTIQTKIKKNFFFLFSLISQSRSKFKIKLKKKPVLIFVIFFFNFLKRFSCCWRHFVYFSSNRCFKLLGIPLNMLYKGFSLFLKDSSYHDHEVYLISLKKFLKKTKFCFERIFGKTDRNLKNLRAFNIVFLE